MHMYNILIIHNIYYICVYICVRVCAICIIYLLYIIFIIYVYICVCVCAVWFPWQLCMASYNSFNSMSSDAFRRL